MSLSANSEPLRLALITPACGGPALKACIDSVRRQTFASLRHYVVADGPGRAAAVRRAIGVAHDRLTCLVLPEATGRNNYNGHRIYGSMPLLLNSEFVAFLDEDNFLDPRHFEHLVALADEHRLDWVYSLRKIVDHTGRFICKDDCDSLGIWGSWSGAQHHVDTNCYLLRRSLAVETGPLWNRPGYAAELVDPDKALCRWLMFHRLRGFTTGRYTVNYRLGSTANSPQKAYFKEGNKVMRSLYRYFPWRSPTLQEIVERKDYRRIVARHETERDKILLGLREQKQRQRAASGLEAAPE